jgi:hypothetical protein
MFKKLLVAAALVTVIAAPAFAQSFDPEVGSGNIAPVVTNQGNQNTTSAYAQATPKSHASARASNRATEPSVRQPYGVFGGTGR